MWIDFFVLSFWSALTCLCLSSKQFFQPIEMYMLIESNEELQYRTHTQAHLHQSRISIKIPISTVLLQLSKVRLICPSNVFNLAIAYVLSTLCLCFRIILLFHSSFSSPCVRFQLVGWLVVVIFIYILIDLIMNEKLKCYCVIMRWFGHIKHPFSSIQTFGSSINSDHGGVFDGMTNIRIMRYMKRLTDFNYNRIQVLLFIVFLFYERFWYSMKKWVKETERLKINNNFQWQLIRDLNSSDVIVSVDHSPEMNYARLDSLAKLLKFGLIVRTQQPIT